MVPILFPLGLLSKPRYAKIKNAGACTPAFLKRFDCALCVFLLVGQVMAAHRMAVFQGGVSN